MNPLISIIIPIYNAETYLEKCINSVISQTYSNLEIIIVDDGSTDGSPDICDDYANNEKRIVVIHKNNGGVSSARNKGLDVAKGEYIGFVDSDDYLEFDMYEKLYNSLISNNADISICGYLLEKEDGAIIKEVSKIPNLKMTQYEALEMTIDSNYFQGFLWNKLFKASIFNLSDKIRLDEDIYMCEDLLCVCKCILKSKIIIGIEESLYHYVSNENSALNAPFNFKKTTILDAYYRINILFKEFHPSLCANIKRSYIKANLSLMVSMNKSNFIDVDTTQKITKNLRTELGINLKSKKFTYKEKMGILIISINPYFFKKLYKLIKKIKVH